MSEGTVISENAASTGCSSGSGSLENEFDERDEAGELGRLGGSPR